MSSTLYLWDTASETFVLKGTASQTKTRLVIEGRDEVISERYFLLFAHVAID